HVGRRLGGGQRATGIDGAREEAAGRAARGYLRALDRVEVLVGREREGAGRTVRDDVGEPVEDGAEDAEVLDADAALEGGKGMAGHDELVDVRELRHEGERPDAEAEARGVRRR